MSVEETMQEKQSVLNIRGFPAGLLRELKVQAAQQGKTLREVVIEKLKR